MISLTPAQRRAEEFASLVDVPVDERDDTAGRHADLLELVGAMRAVPAPAPRPDFVAGLRERLMIEAETALSPTSVERKLSLGQTHTPRRRDRRIAVLAGTIAAIGATSSVAVASQGALPGDTLYPIKRAIEGAQTNLTVGEDAKAKSLLANANGRLAEIEELAARLDLSDAAVLPATLADFSEQADAAAEITFTRYQKDAEQAPLVELREFSAAAMERLGELESLLPSGAVDALNSAVETLLSIDGRIAALCPDCEGTLLELPTRLLFSLRSASMGEQVNPKAADVLPSEAPTSTTPPEPVQAVGDDVIDVDQLEDLLAATAPSTNPSDSAPSGERTTSPTRERAEKAAKALQDALNEGGEALLGDDGLLGPVLSPLSPVLDPLLNPLLGKGGLLNP